jgi:two-component system CheB/CheR fusion protein
MEQKDYPTKYKEKFNECETRFDAVFELTTAASKIIDSELTILRVNSALTDLIGYSAEELTGTQIMEYACEDDKPHWHELQKAMWEEGKPNFKLDVCIVRKDGSLAWVHVTTIAFTENETRYAYTILDDFTDWKKLQESELRLKMALQYSKMAVFELNLADRSLTRSDGFEELFGLAASQEEWNEERLLGLLLPDDQAKLRKILAEIRPGQSFDFQGRTQTPAGVVKWLNLHGRAEKMTGGQTDRALGTLYDITRDKLVERQKDDFISIASHELKTPLTALKGSLQLMERSRQTLDPKMSGLVEQANKSMLKVGTLVDDLLNASRLGEDQLHLHPTRFNLSNAINDCCLHVTAAGVYNIIAAGSKDVEIEADSERIQRVIVNFVNNAVKYAPKSKDILIRVEQLSGQVKVLVTDRGPGIAPEKVPHLFDRYYRTDDDGGQYSGLGLGLYISAEIIRRHNGQIGVDSEPGKGSTFWFTLPSIKEDQTAYEGR